MIEIFIIIRLCKYLSSLAREKNRSAAWGALGAVLWLGCEVGSAVLAAMSGRDGAELYGFALGGAMVGALLSFAIVKSLAPIPSDNGLPEARLL